MTRKLSYLTSEDIADRLQVSRATAYRIARACMHVRHGRLIRDSIQLFVPRDEIEPPTRGFSVLGKANHQRKLGGK